MTARIARTAILWTRGLVFTALVRWSSPRGCPQSSTPFGDCTEGCGSPGGC